MNTIEDYVREHAITVEVVIDRGMQVTDKWEHYAYLLRLHYGDTGRTLETSYSQGTGIDDSPEDRPAEVFDALVSDASVDAVTFEDFAGEFGYDSDSLRAYRIWEALRAMRPQVIAFVGGWDEFEAVLDLERM